MAPHLVIAWATGNFTDGCTNCSMPCIPDTLCVSAAPPSVNSTGDNSTPILLHNRSRLVPNLLIATAALLAASFLLLLATYAVHRYRRRRRPPSPADPPPPPGDDDDLFEDGGGDHHVWHIRTVGLDDATIRSIDACVYTAESGLLDGAADCSVCLAEFRDGELLRLLPKCGHAFHLPCIDTWLRSHVNCPLCRAPILAQAATAAADPENPAPPAAAAIEPVGLDSGSSSLAENTQIDIEQFETAQVVPEEGKEGGAVEIGIRINPTAASSSMLSSSESPGNFGEDGLQPVRRSVSMDSVSLAALLLMVDPEEKSTEERTGAEAVEDQAVKNRGRGANAAKGAPLQKASIKIERSLSSRSGRFFLSRYGRARNSILPL